MGHLLIGPLPRPGKDLTEPPRDFAAPSLVTLGSHSDVTSRTLSRVVTGRFRRFGGQGNPRRREVLRALQLGKVGGGHAGAVRRRRTGRDRDGRGRFVTPG